MSATPPPMTPSICRGRPSAYVVTVPRRGSIRWIRPPVLSVTYRAPSGPTVLPDPQMSSTQGPSTKVASSVTRGLPDSFAVAEAPGASRPTISASDMATVRLRDMAVHLSARRRDRRAGSRVVGTQHGGVRDVAHRPIAA